MIISPQQRRAARAFLSWTIRELAEKVAATPNTIARSESGNETRSNGATLERIHAALESAGIEFLPDNGVRLKSQL